jgi:ATPase subunit of ABC transporter with duplicated ATPase domains
VTHDHDVIDEVATRIWNFQSAGVLEDFKGTYTQILTEQSRSAVPA